jgi:hypothetical protein
MKLLMISTDRLIFKKYSPVSLRMIEYAKNFDELHIIVYSKERIQLNPIQLSSNCWIYSTNSKSRWFYVLNAISLGKLIIKNRKISHITCQDPFLTAMAGVYLKKKFILPLELQIHTDIGSQYYTYSISNRIRIFLAYRYLPKADKIRVVSERIKKYFYLLNDPHRFINF